MDRGLPGCLYNLHINNEENKIPEVLVAKLNKLHSKGGKARIATLIKRAEGEIGNWELFIMQASAFISQEEGKYAENKAKFKEQWTQRPSSELNGGFKEKVVLYLKKIKEARAELAAIKTFYNNQETGLLLTEISRDTNILIAAIPVQKIDPKVKQDKSVEE